MHSEEQSPFLSLLLKGMPKIEIDNGYVSEHSFERPLFQSGRHCFVFLRYEFSFEC